jgi:uncharacterized membrane protein
MIIETVGPVCSPSLRRARVPVIAAPFLLLLLLGVVAVSGCGDELPEVDCAAAPVPTFQEVTIWPKCTSCHSSTRTGAARSGAPAGVDFDTYASASAHAQKAAEEVNEGEMPRNGTATAAEKDSLFRWALCGKPQ